MILIDLRNITGGIFARAQEWEILPETFANPMKRAKVGPEVGDGARSASSTMTRPPPCLRASKIRSF